MKKENVKFFKQDDNLKEFMRVLRQNDKLTDDEEQALFEQYKANGDIKIREQLILKNQRFVYSLAKDYARDESEVMDYVNEGNIGLMEAIEKFDPTLGFKFITYAKWYIKREMNYYLMNTRDIMNSSNNMKLAGKLDVVEEDFFNKHGYLPSIEEKIAMLKEKFNIDILDERDVYDVVVDSIDEEIGEDMTLEDTIDMSDKTIDVSIEDNETKEEHVKNANYFLGLINSKECPEIIDIIKKYYGIGCETAYSISDIAEEYMMSEEEIEQKMKKAIMYMKAKDKESLNLLAKLAI